MQWVANDGSRTSTQNPLSTTTDDDYQSQVDALGTLQPIYLQDSLAEPQRQRRGGLLSFTTSVDQVGSRSLPVAFRSHQPGRSLAVAFRWTRMYHLPRHGYMLNINILRLGNKVWHWTNFLVRMRSHPRRVT